MEGDKPEHVTPKQILPRPVQTQADQVRSDGSSGSAAAVSELGPPPPPPPPPSAIQDLNIDNAINSLAEMLVYFKNLKARSAADSEEETHRVLLLNEASPGKNRASWALMRNWPPLVLHGDAASAVDRQGDGHGIEEAFVDETDQPSSSAEKACERGGGNVSRYRRRSARNQKKCKKNAAYGSQGMNNMNEVDFDSGTGRNRGSSAENPIPFQKYTSDTHKTGQPNASPRYDKNMYPGNGSQSRNQKPSPFAGRDGSWNIPGQHPSSGSVRYYDSASNEPVQDIAFNFYGFPIPAVPEIQHPFPGSEQGNYIGLFNFPEFVDGQQPLHAVASVQSAQAILAYPNQFLSFQNLQACAFVPNGLVPPPLVNSYYGQMSSVQQSANIFQQQQHGSANAYGTLSLNHRASSANLSYYPPQQSRNEESLYEAVAGAWSVYSGEEE